jgi:hypothetical protein
MRRRAAFLSVAAGALLFSSAAPAVRDVPGDPTPPVVVPVITGALGLNGWYTSNITLGWSVTDPESIILSESGCDTVTFNADSSQLSRTCSATSDGGTTTITKPLKLDKTPPVANAAASRGSDSNGWYNHSLSVSFSGNDAMSGVDSCSPATPYGGPDSANASVSGSCKDQAGNTAVTSLSLRYDATGPDSVSGTPGRQPDANGWYNRPVTVTFHAGDTLSGVAACTQATYGGPDDASAALIGSCTDRAGNAAGGSFGLKYDNTAPTILAVTTKLGNRSAHVAWRKSSDTQVVEVLRSPGRKGEGESVVYRGAANGFVDTGLAIGRKYEYRVVGIDAAENRSARTVDLVATGPLLSPAPGARVKGPPTLDWIPVKGATYYNLQIVRGRKVLSTWPVQSSFRLRRTWSYNGRRYRLRPGTYRWYVWPGFGRISASRFGRLLGSSTFVVTR